MTHILVTYECRTYLTRTFIPIEKCGVSVGFQMGKIQHNQYSSSKRNSRKKYSTYRQSKVPLLLSTISLALNVVPVWGYWNILQKPSKLPTVLQKQYIDNESRLSYHMNNPFRPTVTIARTSSSLPTDCLCVLKNV